MISRAPPDLPSPRGRGRATWEDLDPPGGPRGPSRAAWVRRVRLTCGLTLLSYASTHLLNHALGLISLAAMEASRAWFLAFWRNPVGTAALYGALLTHFGLALWALWERRHLRMPGWDAAWLALGLAVERLPRREVTVRSRAEPLGIRLFADAGAIAEALGAEAGPRPPC